MVSSHLHTPTDSDVKQLGSGQLERNILGFDRTGSEEKGMSQTPGGTRQTCHSAFLTRKNKQEVVIVINYDEKKVDRGVWSDQGTQSKNIFEP